MSKTSDPRRGEGRSADNETDAYHVDMSGRKRYGQNVLAGWIVEFVVIVSGFITPRIIDAKLGQAQLGIWDHLIDICVTPK